MRSDTGPRGDGATIGGGPPRFGRWFTAAYERRTAAIERVADSLGEPADRDR